MKKKSIRDTPIKIGVGGFEEGRFAENQHSVRYGFFDELLRTEWVQ